MVATAAKARPAYETTAQGLHTDAVRDGELESLGAWHPTCVNAALEELTHAKLVCRLCVMGCGALVLVSVASTLFTLR